MPGTGLFRSSTASPAVSKSVTSKESGNTLRDAGLSLDDKWAPIGSALFLYFLSVRIVEAISYPAEVEAAVHLNDKMQRGFR